MWGIDMAESGVQKQTRLVAARAGKLLFRNNSGAFQDQNGRWIRYGLANDSSQLNDEIKSSDLIGVSPYLVTAQDVGRVLGVFVAAECKPGDWHYTGTDREKAQLKFMNLVKQHGGFAGFINDPRQILEICR